MSDSDRPHGWVEQHPGRANRMGQTVRLSKAPEAKEVITWPQRPQPTGKLIRCKVLISEANIFWSLNAGDIVDLHESDATPRLRSRRCRLARPDEHLTHVIE